MTEDRTEDIAARCRKRLDEWAAEGLLRALPATGAHDGPFVQLDGRRLLNLSANDYLGLAADRHRAEAFLRSLSAAEAGMGSSASRLLGGDHAATARLEAVLADAYGPGRAALVFNSGYHANAGILPALAARRDLILVDKLAHASILDGIRLGNAAWLRYRHGDLPHLASLLEARRSQFESVFIVTESVFSMDGDTADLTGLVELKNRYGAVLYVDEAHALGVRGARGLGLAEEENLLAGIDILVGTFGKALASCGAFAILDPVIKDFLVNTMRPLIFSTALPPLVAAWNRRGFEDMQSMNRERRALAALATRLRDGLAQAGLATGGASQIVPVILGENAAAAAAAARLRDAGFLACPIRPPTVPRGTARLRFSLNALMRQADLDRLPGLLAPEAGA